MVATQIHYIGAYDFSFLKGNLSGVGLHGFSPVFVFFKWSILFVFVLICTVGKTTYMLRQGLTVETSL